MPIVAILEWPATEGLDMKAEYARVSDELNGDGRSPAPPTGRPG